MSRTRSSNTAKGGGAIPRLLPPPPALRCALVKLSRGLGLLLGEEGAVPDLSDVAQAWEAAAAKYTQGAQGVHRTTLSALTTDLTGRASLRVSLASRGDSPSCCDAAKVTTIKISQPLHVF